jgi:hypothetical protein
VAVSKNDAVTGQLPGMPGKRGRPPTGKAKSSAERVRAYRARKAAQEPDSIVVSISGEVLDALRQFEAKCAHSGTPYSVLQLVDSALRSQLVRWGFSFAPNAKSGQGDGAARSPKGEDSAP